MKPRIVDVVFALVTPDRQVGKAQHERMISGQAVHETMLVDIARAECVEANETNPVFNRRVTIDAFTLVVEGCGEIKKCCRRLLLNYESSELTFRCIFRFQLFQVWTVFSRYDLKCFTVVQCL